MRKSLKHALLGATFLMLAQGAQAATTQVGNTNEFRDSTGKLSFSLSLTPTAGSVPSVLVPSLPAGQAATPSSPTASFNVFGADSRLGVSLGAVRATGTTTSAAIATGSAVGGAQAPYVSATERYAGTYLALTDLTQAAYNYSPYAYASVEFQNANGSAVRAKSMQVLWGSVGQYDLMGINGIYVDGSDILAAASKLGISGGNQGSFYVTFNALAGTTFTGFSAYTGADAVYTTQMELAPLSYSTANGYAARDAYAENGAAGLGGGAAPAPLPALAGSVPGFLALAGFLARRRRARA